MTVYGIKIKSDIEPPIELLKGAEFYYEVELVGHVPQNIIDSQCCNFLLLKTPKRNIYMHSDHEFDREIEKYEKDQTLCYEVENVVKFYWKVKEKKIYYELLQEGNSNLLFFWFIKYFLPLYMSLEQMFNIVHAGAIELEGKVVLFSAPSMYGKSTLVNYFIKKGHTLVSDDYVAVYKQGDRVMTTASYPYYRPFRGEEIFGEKSDQVLQEFRPIHIIYVLEKSNANSDVVIKELHGFEKFDAMLSNYMYNIAQVKKEQMKFFTFMLSAVKIFKIYRPWDLKRIDEVYQAIIKHQKESV